MSPEDEEQLLRSVALQNARSVLQERLRVERALFEERERLRITLASIGDAVISTDAEGRVVFLNGVAETLTGWPQAEAAGRPLIDIFVVLDESTRQPVDNPALLALREGRVVSLADRTLLLARDGSERPIGDSAAPMRDEAGATIGTVLVFRDVSERRKAEEARGRLAAIVESSDDAILSKTLDGVIQSWNAGAARLFGYTREEAVGQPVTLLIPPDRIDEEASILARLRRGERIEHFETIRVAKDGRRLDISLTVSPVKDPAGRIIGASTIARDISERRRLEQELQRRVLELADADRKKDDFIALLAHELRNPLAPLRTGLEVMRLASQDENESVARARAMMDRQLSHMVRLIDDLLDISRMTSNKLYLQRSRVLLSEVISEALEAAMPAIEAAGHVLHVSLPPSPVSLDADPTRLAQVFGNLLTNSAKYTPQRGNIWLTADARAGMVAVSVRDDGLGIPADALPRIFEMFSQVDRSVERLTGGLGIGLALVKGLVEAHGGAVLAESPGAGAGSTFTVRLPVAARDQRPAPQGPGVADATQVGRRVLVADDNRDAAMSMASLLKLLGHEVHVAHDGLEAVAVAERVRPDLVLMDVGMPRLNGLDAARQIREQPWGAGVAIIALTGWGQDGDRQRSHVAGCDGHLVKPVGTLELEKLLADLRKRPKG